ncbi:hypothetical protein ACO0SA_003383 [Hanseniaspora valbyensis]
MHFRNLKLCNKATKAPNYYTSNTSYIQYSNKGSTASSAASALASLSIGAAAGTFVLKNVQKKCLLELEEQQKNYQDADILKEDFNTVFTRNSDINHNGSMESASNISKRQRRSKFRTSSFSNRHRRSSFDGFSANVLKVDKNIKANGVSPSYAFKMDVFGNTNKYFTKDKNSNESSYSQKAKKKTDNENKVYANCGSSHIKYAAAVQLVKNANKIEKNIFKDENKTVSSEDQLSSEKLVNDMQAMSLFNIRRSSIVSDTQKATQMLKSTSMQTQVSFDLNDTVSTTNISSERPLNKKFTKEISKSSELDQQIKLIENLKLDDWLQDKDIVVSEEVYEKTKQIWPADGDKGFNSLKFKETLTIQIDNAFAQKDYNKIYSLYLAMKRNDCVPSVETFDKIIKSLCLRSEDKTNLDERMFNILTCYQDLIGLKIKPLASTYHDIILALLNGSITAIENNNGNGKDFYKIALDFFKTTYPSVLKKNLSIPLVESLLFSSLQYQTNLNSQYIYSILPQLMASYKPISTQQYHYLMIKFSFDLQTLQQSVFSCINPHSNMVDIDFANVKDSILVVSAVTTGLMKLNNLPLASQILNSTMTFFKMNEMGLSNDIKLKQELLETYLLQLSQIDLAKAEQLRSVFELKAETENAFIPKLSFNFYKTYLYNTMCWLPQQANISMDLTNISKNIFKRLFSMNVNILGDSYSTLTGKNRWESIIDLSNNISPASLSYEKLMNQLFNYCFHQSEQDLVLITMILEDSVMKNYKFSGEQYFKIFEFLINEIKASDEYILRFVNSHGLLNLEDLQFLNTIVSSLENNNKSDLIIKISKSKYFISLTSKFDLEKMNDFEFKGLTKVFQSIWSTQQDLSMIAVDLGVHSFVLNEVFNLEYLYNQVEHKEETKTFFKQLEENFKERYLNFKKFNLDETKLDSQVEHLATRVLGL